MKSSFRDVLKPVLKYYVYFLYLEDSVNPVYVGKGQKDRYMHYFYYPEKVSNRILRRKLVDAKQNNKEYSVEIAYETDSEVDALDVEEFYISFYGRLFNNTGILYNFESGGTESSSERPMRRQPVYIDGFVFDSVSRAMEVTGIKHETIKKYVSIGRASYLNNKDDVDRVFEFERKLKWKNFYDRHRKSFRAVRNRIKNSNGKLGKKNGMYGKTSAIAKKIEVEGVTYPSINKAAREYGYAKGDTFRRYLEKGKHNLKFKIYD